MEVLSAWLVRVRWVRWLVGTVEGGCGGRIGSVQLLKGLLLQSVCPHLTSAARLLCWSAHTRPRPDLSSGPVCCPVPTLDSALSTQAPPRTRTPHGRLWSKLYDLSGAAPRSTLSPETLRYRELRPHRPPFLASKGSPCLSVGFVLSVCVCLRVWRLSFK